MSHVFEVDFVKGALSLLRRGDVRIDDFVTGSMGGSSGVLLSIFLTSIGRAYAQTGAWPKALESGIASLQTYGGAAVGDRTMIDALVPANKALPAGKGLPRAGEMAHTGAEATAKKDLREPAVPPT